jgi:hypothetical protein
MRQVLREEFKDGVRGSAVSRFKPISRLRGVGELIVVQSGAMVRLD